MEQKEEKLKSTRKRTGDANKSWRPEYDGVLGRQREKTTSITRKRKGKN